MSCKCFRPCTPLSPPGWCAVVLGAHGFSVWQVPLRGWEGPKYAGSLDYVQARNLTDKSSMDIKYYHNNDKRKAH